MPASAPLPISKLLAHWNQGDREARKSLVPLFYGDLRWVARNHLRKEQRGHTLQTTALVHEALSAYRGNKSSRYPLRTRRHVRN